MPNRSDSARVPAGPRSDVPALRAFVAVARAGTVGRAARALGRTQPSISARIAALENAWGARLFRRRARGMTLTPEGARLLPLAESALRGFEELDRAAGVEAGEDAAIRVGAGDALGRSRLPRAVARLLRRRPGLDVRILEGPGPRLLDALRHGEIDLAFVLGPTSGPDVEGLELEPFLRSAVEVLVPAREGDREAGPLRPIRLAARRLVGLQAGSAFRFHLESAFAARGLEFRPAVEVGNLSLVRRFVAAGSGVAPVPQLAFEARQDASGVRRVPVEGIPPLVYHRAVRAGAPLSAACRELLDLLGSAARMQRRSGGGPRRSHDRT